MGTAVGSSIVYSPLFDQSAALHQVPPAAAWPCLLSADPHLLAVCLGHVHLESRNYYLCLGDINRV